MVFSHRYAHNFDLIGIPQTDALMNKWPDFKSEENLLCHFEKLLDISAGKIIYADHIIPKNNALKRGYLRRYGISTTRNWR